MYLAVFAQLMASSSTAVVVVVVVTMRMHILRADTDVAAVVWTHCTRRNIRQARTHTHTHRISVTVCAAIRSWMPRRIVWCYISCIVFVIVVVAVLFSTVERLLLVLHIDVDTHPSVFVCARQCECVRVCWILDDFGLFALRLFFVSYSCESNSNTKYSVCALCASSALMCSCSICVSLALLFSFEHARARMYVCENAFTFHFTFFYSQFLLSTRAFVDLAKVWCVNKKK